MAVQSVDDYLAQTPPPQRAALERIRDTVKSLVPEAEESISYMMPAFKYNGKPLLYYAAFKHHLSVFPTAGPATTLAAKLKDFETTKGTIKFTLDHPLSTELIAEIIETRKSEIESS